MNHYRHEIDGLRCVAVVSVVLFHAGFPGFRGGFVGVDVFFVISGYLITSMISADREANNFSLITFYERRSRRILPALILVLLCTLPFAFIWMLPYQLKDLAQGLISITLFSSNILFWMKEGYFAEDTELNPLVHTWSLAVEEQFYIFFPLTLMLLWRFGKQRMILVLSLVALLSLILAQWSGNLELRPPFVKTPFLWFSQHHWASFYLPTGRIWELLLGTFTAFYLQKHSISCGIYKEATALIGLTLVLYAVVLFNKETPFPSLYTVVPTVGSVLLILCADSTTHIGRILSLPLFTKIGLISYSVYLWHQPLLAFARISHSNPLSLRISSSNVILSLVLAYFSWRFVENPFRNKEKFSRIFIFKSAALAAIIIILLAIGIIITSGTKRGSNQVESYLLNFESRLVQLEYVHQRFDPLQALRFNSSMKKIAVIGDSFAMDFLNMAVENNKLTNYEIKTYYVNYICQIYAGNEDKNQFIPEIMKKGCALKEYDIRSALPLIEQANIVIFASKWAIWSAERLPMTIKTLNLPRQNQTLIVISSKDFGQINPIHYLNKTSAYRSELRNHMDPACVTANEFLQKGLNDSILVNIPQMLCTINYTCPIFTSEEKLISFDGEHLTKDGAIYIGKIIFQNRPLTVLT
jgi:peptidoglycan/LPS O-acetylase OafA/YrhL